MIDHHGAARSVDLVMPTVLIYGDQRSRTPLMLSAPDFELELPLRLLVREGEDGKTYFTDNPAATLEGKHGLAAGMARKLTPVEGIIASGLIASSANDPTDAVIVQSWTTHFNRRRSIHAAS
jgi:uncharacterized protein (DUF302 family)